MTHQPETPRSLLSSNYHMHSRYCDGQGEIRDYVEAAIACGMTTIGTSSHAPVPFANTYAVHPDQLDAYIADVRALQQTYRNRIELGMAFEVDVIPGLEDHFASTIVPRGFDYFIGSVHHVGVEPETGDPWEFDAGPDHFAEGFQRIFQGDIRSVVTEFYARERLVPSYIPGITIVGHMDRIKRFNYGDRYFHEDEQWYRDEVEATLAVYAAADIIVELNTAGWRTPTGSAFPSAWICRRCHELGIRMQINTDAHSPTLLMADQTRGIAQLHDAGYREVWVRRQGAWVAEPLPEL